VVVVDRGVPGVTRGSGNSGGERDGHEAETFPLQVLHGGAHVLLHGFGAVACSFCSQRAGVTYESLLACS
jgi:hypothetical protein